MSVSPARAAPPRRTALGLGLVVLLALAIGMLWPKPGPAQGAGVTAISAGALHTCVLTATGDLKCWGANGLGQLGDGRNCGTPCTTPVDVVGLGGGAAAFVAGSFHTCALTLAGGVKCWGSNAGGQLGDGTTAKRTAPVDVSGLTSGVTAVAVGGVDIGHTCALTTAGGVKCWGYNFYGHLGDGTSGSGNNRTTPVDVVGLESSVAAVALGGFHSCALTAAGGVKCWGYNVTGQLGNGMTSFSQTVPVDVVGLTSGVAEISAGGRHTCALTTVGSVKCWGANEFGQLGDGTTSTRTTPVDVVGLGGGVAAVDAGAVHTCALTTAGGVKCWGDNDVGQLGDGTTADRTAPVEVPGLSDGVAAIAVGGINLGAIPAITGHTCAATTGGGVKCWGGNSLGQLGNGTRGALGDANSTPGDVAGLEPKPIGGIALDPDLGALGVETPSGGNTGLPAGIIASVATGVVAFGTAAWYARKASD